MEGTEDTTRRPHLPTLLIAETATKMSQEGCDEAMLTNYTPRGGSGPIYFPGDAEATPVAPAFYFQAHGDAKEEKLHGAKTAKNEPDDADQRKEVAAHVLHTVMNPRLPGNATAWQLGETEWTVLGDPPTSWWQPARYQERDPLAGIARDRADSVPGLALRRYMLIKKDLATLPESKNGDRPLLEAQMDDTSKTLRGSMSTSFFFLDSQRGLFPAQIVFLHHDLQTLEKSWASPDRKEPPSPDEAIHAILHCLPQGTPKAGWIISWLPIERLVQSGTDVDALPAVPYVRLALEAPEGAPAPRLPGQGARTLIMAFFINPMALLHQWSKPVNMDAYQIPNTPASAGFIKTLFKVSGVTQ